MKFAVRMLKYVDISVILMEWDLSLTKFKLKKTVEAKNLTHAGIFI